MPTLRQRAATQSVRRLPQIPAWTTTFPTTDPNRLHRFWYGFSDAIVGTGAIAANAQHGASRVGEWQNYGIDCLRFDFQFSDLWPTAGSSAMNEGVYQGIKTVVQNYLAAGVNLLINPHDDTGVVYLDLHNNTAGGHYNWAWFAAAWPVLVNRLANEIPGFSSGRVMLELISEMGLGVADVTRSMTTYNNFLANVVPLIRAALPDYTFAIDTYPTGAENQWTYSGVVLALPADTNMVVNIHTYRPTVFTQIQGNADTSASAQGGHYIAGIPWGSTLAQIGTYLSTYTNGGLMGTGDTLMDNQILWWRTNYASQIDTDGFTKAALQNALGGIVAYCVKNQRALMVGECGSEGIGLVNLPMSATDANAYDADQSAVLGALGIPTIWWIRQHWSTDPTNAIPGDGRFIPSRLASNVSRRAPITLNSLASAPADKTGLVVWYDSAAATVSAQKINPWFDLSGNVNDTVQGTPGARPGYNLTQQNGLPVITNDGSDDNVAPTTALVLTDYDLIVVASAPAGVSTPVILGNSGTNTQALRLDMAAGTLKCFDTVQSNTSQVLPVAASTMSVLEISRTGGVVSMTQNGTALTVTPSGIAQPTITINSLWNLGGTPQATTNVCAVLIFSQQLTPARRAAWIAFLRARFNV